MLKMFLVASLLLLIVILIASKGKKLKIRRRWILMRNFFIMMSKKSEDRLQSFLGIHKVFPRFLHIDKFGLKILLVYDPEILKK